MIALAILTAASLCFLALLYLRAPYGWQDSAGFHTGHAPARLPSAGDLLKGRGDPVTAASMPGSLSFHSTEVSRGQ